MKHIETILLVAKFTGIVLIKGVNKNGDEYYYYYNAEMQDYESLPDYDTWNEIIPIVHKIKNMQHDTKEMFMGTTFERKIEFENVTELPIYTPIETIFDRVVNFIIWYNDQN